MRDSNGRSRTRNLALTHLPRLANGYDRLVPRAVDVAFGLLAVGWLLYILRITGEFSFWSDDLFLLDQAGSWGGLFQPYNDHLSAVILSIYRVSAEWWGLAYTPFMVVGAVSLLAVPVAYYATTRRLLGPPLAAIFAIPLLWHRGMDLRPSGLNHYLALVGGIVCAAALNRGRRADGVVAASLLFSLSSAGGGVVVAAACFVHNLLVRAPLRRWAAVLVPSALWGCWWLVVARAASLSSEYSLSIAESARAVRDLCLVPFYEASLGVRPMGVLLVGGYLLYGAMQLRRGLAAGANFMAWSVAMVLWAVALVRSRGLLADPGQFRYAYLSLGFALLAVVPGQASRWSGREPFVTRRWLAAAWVIVLVLGGIRGLAVRDDLQDFARAHTERGRQAQGTLLVLGLGPEVIPDDAPISFFGIFTTHGSAGQVREMLDRYGSPFAAVAETADQDLVDLEIVRADLGGARRSVACQELTEPFRDPGVPDHGAVAFGRASVSSPLRLWSSAPFAVEVRRYGSDWVRLVDVPAGRVVRVTLPVLNTDRLWQVRADGACDVSSRVNGG